MTDKKPRALIPLPSGGLEKIGSGPKSILSGIVSDALALARVREKPLAAARFRIGDYEFRDPDYRQILIWAKALELEPEIFISYLVKSSFEDCDEYWWDDFESGFEVDNGSIVSLAWNFDTFPISSFEWVDGLKIKRLRLRGFVKTKISLNLPLLNYLDCSGVGLTELNLLNVPKLTSLNCCENNLVELDLSRVPVLEKLWCGAYPVFCGKYPESGLNFKLAELDLSKVPALTKLHCLRSSLVELDLSKVPMLTEINCSDNQLVKLDFSKVPMLTELNCNDNRLVKLDISKVPRLNKLRCGYNQLVELDLSKVPALTGLYCARNPLVELDLSMVPALASLFCGYDQLIELDLSKVPALAELYCYSKHIVELDIRELGKLERFSCDPSLKLKKLPTQNF